MRTWKFLAKGAIGPISRFHWPTGEWVEAEGPLGLCDSGAHVCRPEDLAHWLSDELWEVEVDGEIQQGLDCLVARRARLVRRVDAWSDGGHVRFAEACRAHAIELANAAGDEARTRATGYIDDARQYLELGLVAVSAFCAAAAVAKLASPDEEETAYHRERAWQAAWIVRHLGL
jgi:hypothetical protein